MLEYSSICPVRPRRGSYRPSYDVYTFLLPTYIMPGVLMAVVGRKKSHAGGDLVESADAWKNSRKAKSRRCWTR